MFTWQGPFRGDKTPRVQSRVQFPSPDPELPALGGDMLNVDVVAFDGFSLDPTARQLRYQGTVRPLRAKSLAVLHYLTRHPDRLVTQSELLRAVWPGVRVSPTVLRVCVREIRAALGNETASRLVTVAGRGY